ncbi:hypothetical protein [Priestia megaterium]|uniref:hypothetical protein n=1 Tax=Priestia megaterium TaxID=1404 RepID=UPI002814295B|nr:hypothetical protein [Priestia megaterium]MDR0128673.1 hypothetical protein [Priestia megaterium]
MKTKKWLVGIIVLVFILSVPVLLVARGMTWKWTSFAPGNTDAWIGFWGGYLGAIIGALAAGAIAYFVAHKQINLQAEMDNKREKQFLATQLRIEKYQEAYSLLAETNREFAIISLLPVDYYRGSIDLEKFKIAYNQSQDKIMAFRRSLIGLEPFVEGLEGSLKIISELNTKMDTIIYNNYTSSKNSDGNKEIKNPRIIDEVHRKLMLYIVDVCKKINEYLKNELNKLEKESC